MAVVLYSGNVGIGQDLGTVLRAIAGLDGAAGVTVRVVGGGKALPRFRQLADELGLSNVQFHPPVPLYQLPDLLAAGDIHVICQQPGTEGLLVPSKVYSTLAAGRPSIFVGPADCEVGRIVCESESGFVVEPGDVGKAMDALRYLVGPNRCGGRWVAKVGCTMKRTSGGTGASLASSIFSRSPAMAPGRADSVSGGGGGDGRIDSLCCSIGAGW